MPDQNEAKPSLVTALEAAQRAEDAVYKRHYAVAHPEVLEPKPLGAKASK